MLRSLQIEPEKCTGCLQCEMACSYQAEGVFNPAISRIKSYPCSLPELVLIAGCQGPSGLDSGAAL